MEKYGIQKVTKRMMEMAILILGIAFKTEIIPRCIKMTIIIEEGSIHQEYRTIITIYTQSEASKQ